MTRGRGTKGKACCARFGTCSAKRREKYKSPYCRQLSRNNKITLALHRDNAFCLPILGTTPQHVASTRSRCSTARRSGFFSLSLPPSCSPRRPPAKASNQRPRPFARISQLSYNHCLQVSQLYMWPGRVSWASHKRLKTRLHQRIVHTAAPTCWTVMVSSEQCARKDETGRIVACR